MENCIITWRDFGGLRISDFYTVLRGCESSYCGDNGMGGGDVGSAGKDKGIAYVVDSAGNVTILTLK
jgi:hypothetical protein